MDYEKTQKVVGSILSEITKSNILLKLSKSIFKGRVKVFS